MPGSRALRVNGVLYSVTPHPVPYDECVSSARRLVHEHHSSEDVETVLSRVLHDAVEYELPVAPETETIECRACLDRPLTDGDPGGVGVRVQYTDYPMGEYVTIGEHIETSVSLYCYDCFTQPDINLRPGCDCDEIQFQLPGRIRRSPSEMEGHDAPYAFGINLYDALPVRIVEPADWERDSLRRIQEGLHDIHRSESDVQPTG